MGTGTRPGPPWPREITKGGDKDDARKALRTTESKRDKFHKDGRSNSDTALYACSARPPDPNRERELRSTLPATNSRNGERPQSGELSTTFTAGLSDRLHEAQRE